MKVKFQFQKKKKRILEVVIIPSSFTKLQQFFAMIILSGYTKLQQYFG